MCCHDTIGDDTLTHPIPVFATYGDASRYCAEMHRKHSDIVICFRVVPWSRYWEAKNRIEWCTRLRHCAGNVHILIYNVSWSRLRHAQFQLAWVVTYLCDRTALTFTACKPKQCVGIHIAYMTCSSLSFSPCHSLSRKWFKWWNNNMWCSAYIHTRIHTYLHTYMHRRTYIYTYIHT